MGILVVDDNQVNLFVIENVLKRAGYREYRSFLSAAEMFDYLLSEPIHIPKPVDVILMDIMMPEMDGIEACRKLQSHAKLRDIPVIFVTAIEDSDKVAEALDAGGMDYVMKPINKTDLLARIRVAMRLKQEKDWHKKQDEKIMNELELSKQVQTSLLSEAIYAPDFSICASYLPANSLAGDLYYWYKVDEHRYAVILLDMMGHGISASLVCMFISSILRDSIRTCSDPDFVITELNRWMQPINSKNMQIPYYFTAIYMVIDTENKTVEYVNAGHPAAYALVDQKEMKELGNSTCAVGLFDHMQAEKTVIGYKESIQIVLFTDGVPEALDKRGFNGLDLLRRKTSSLFAIEHGCEPIDFMLSKEYQEEAEDDMCVVVIQASSK